MTLCSCERSPKIKLGGVGDDPTWISSDESRQVEMQLLTNRYPHARIVSQLTVGQTCTYRFTTNIETHLSPLVPVAVVVDRKTAKATFENVSH